MPAYAVILGAPGSPRVPLWLGRVLGGPYAVHLMTRMPGASNQRAKTALAEGSAAQPVGRCQVPAGTAWASGG